MQINSNYIFIDNKQSLELALVSLGNAKVISIDTESSGYYTYYSKVCLIQITCNGKNYIFDPLSLIDLKKLGNIFSNDKILKVFHSASDDIKALKRDFSFEFKNIADTFYSSKLLGMEHNSLYYLVEHYHNIQLSKTEQKSNWEKRPLDKFQLKYAALDTVYLESIWIQMKEEMQKQGLLEEAVSEFKKIAEEIYTSKKEDDEGIQWYKFPEIMKFSGEEKRTIFDLLTFREEKAKRINKSPFRVMSKETLEDIAKNKPSEEKLIELFGKKDGETVSNLLKTPSGPPFTKSDIPKINQDVEPEQNESFVSLRKWREEVMRHRKIDHSMLLSNKQMIMILEKNPNTLEDIASLNIMSDWKLNNYGPSILHALKKEPYDILIRNLYVINNQKKKIKNSPKSKEPSNKDRIKLDLKNET